MASFDKFIICVKGQSCHGSTLEKGVDPVNIAAHLLIALQTIQTREISGTASSVITVGKITGGTQYNVIPDQVVSVNIAAHLLIALQTIQTREISGTASSVITVGKITGGTQYNVIPDQVVLEGTIRALDETVRQYIARRIKELAVAISAMFGGSCECEIIWGAPPVVNDETMAELAAKAVSDLFEPKDIIEDFSIPNMGGEDFANCCECEIIWGAPPVVNDETMAELAAKAVSDLFEPKDIIEDFSIPNMGGEDFANYLLEVPGAFFFLSSSNEKKGTDIPHHNPTFNIDEDVMWKGTVTFVRIIHNMLQIEKK